MIDSWKYNTVTYLFNSIHSQYCNGIEAERVQKENQRQLMKDLKFILE